MSGHRVSTGAGDTRAGAGNTPPWTTAGAQPAGVAGNTAIPPSPGAEEPLRAYLVVALVAFAVLLWPLRSGDVDTANLLQGSDDVMRMVRVVDLLDGQAWTDPVERRVNPPDGVAMHWSRLADLPVAAAILLLEPWLGRDEAVRLAARAVPAVLGGVFVALFFWVAHALTPRGHWFVPLTMTGALLIPLLQFRPGRIDHHGLQLVLVALAAGFLFRCLRYRTPRHAVGLGVGIAASLAVGLEALPFVAAATGILAIAGIMRRDMAVPLAAYGAALAGAVLLLYPVTVPPTEWTAAACDRMSLPHLTAAFAVAAAGGTALLVRGWASAARWPLRLATVGGAAVAGVAVLAAAFPQCVGSPYADLAPEIRYWFDKVSEVQSLAAYFGGSPGTAVANAVLPTAALAYAGYHAARSPVAMRDPLWLAPVLLALTGAALLAWQIRNTSYAGLMAAILLLPLAAAVDDRVDRIRRLAARVLLRLGTPVACAGAVVLPVLVEIAVQGDDADDGADAQCDLAAALPALTDPAALGAQPRVVAAPIDQGPAILFLTHHRVLAAPYHRNVRGLIDNRLLFAGTEAQALETVRRRGVDAVLFCRRYVAATAYPGKPGFLNDRLAAGNPPRWLVPVARSPDAALYRVDLGVAPTDTRATAPADKRSRQGESEPDPLHDDTPRVDNTATPLPLDNRGCTTNPRRT